MATTYRRLLTPVAATAVAMGAFLAAVPQASAVPSAVEGTTGEVFTGQATFYDPGLSACGGRIEPTDFAVALNSDEFGNPSESCGKQISITYGGKEVEAVVLDECLGCGVNGLDLTPGLFQALAGDLSRGTINVEWSFI